VRRRHVHDATDYDTTTPKTRRRRHTDMVTTKTSTAHTHTSASHTTTMTSKTNYDVDRHDDEDDAYDVVTQRRYTHDVAADINDDDVDDTQRRRRPHPVCDVDGVVLCASSELSFVSSTSQPRVVGIACFVLWRCPVVGVVCRQSRLRRHRVSSTTYRSAQCVLCRRCVSAS
jgi:hypothetical protein